MATNTVAGGELLLRSLTIMLGVSIVAAEHQCWVLLMQLLTQMLWVIMVSLDAIAVGYYHGFFYSDILVCCSKLQAKRIMQQD